MKRYIVAIAFISDSGTPDVALYPVDAETAIDAAKRIWGGLDPTSIIGKQVDVTVTRVTEARAGRLGETFFRFIKGKLRT